MSGNWTRTWRRIGTDARSGRWSRTTATAAAAIGLAALPLVGCSDDPVEPGDDPQASVSIADEGAGAASQVSFALASAEASGTFDAEVEADLEAEADAAADLGSPANVTVELQTGQGTAAYTNVQVPARTYTGIRLLVRNASATVEEGSTLNLTAGPVTLAATTTIDVVASSGTDIVIQKQFGQPVNLAAGATLNVQVDLNSATWLDAAVVDTQANTGTVAEAAFAGAVQASAQAQ